MIRMVHRTGKTMTIKFRSKNVDTEDVREAIEDNLGVEILQIDEE
jgi:hypothetical protein